MSRIIDFLEKLNWTGISEEFLASAMVAILFGGLFPWWLKRSQRPKSVVIEMDPAFDNSFKTENDTMNFDISLMLSNDEKVMLKEKIYWKIMIPKEIEILAISEDISEPDYQEPFNVIMGELVGPLFPNRALSVTGLKGSYNVTKLKEPKIYFEISTEFGLYPKGMKKFYKNTSGFDFTDEVIDSLGRIELKEE